MLFFFFFCFFPFLFFCFLFSARFPIFFSRLAILFLSEVRASRCIFLDEVHWAVGFAKKMFVRGREKKKGRTPKKGPKKMSKPNYGRVTSDLLEVITELNRGGHRGPQNNQRVARADELAARLKASAMGDFANEFADVHQYEEPEETEELDVAESPAAEEERAEETAERPGEDVAKERPADAPEVPPECEPLEGGEIFEAPEVPPEYENPKQPEVEATDDLSNLDALYAEYECAVKYVTSATESAIAQEAEVPKEVAGSMSDEEGDQASRNAANEYLAHAIAAVDVASETLVKAAAALAPQRLEDALCSALYVVASDETQIRLNVLLDTENESGLARTIGVFLEGSDLSLTKKAMAAVCNWRDADTPPIIMACNYITSAGQSDGLVQVNTKASRDAIDRALRHRISDGVSSQPESTAFAVAHGCTRRMEVGRALTAARAYRTMGDREPVLAWVRVQNTPFCLEVACANALSRDYSTVEVHYKSLLDTELIRSDYRVSSSRTMLIGGKRHEWQCCEGTNLPDVKTLVVYFGPLARTDESFEACAPTSAAVKAYVKKGHVAVMCATDADTTINVDDEMMASFVAFHVVDFDTGRVGDESIGRIRRAFAADTARPMPSAPTVAVLNLDKALGLRVICTDLAAASEVDLEAFPRDISELAKGLMALRDQGL
jgi:hypothetical protein